MVEFVPTNCSKNVKFSVDNPYFDPSDGPMPADCKEKKGKVWVEGFLPDRIKCKNTSCPFYKA
jgi:hypothetical protein